MEESHSIYFFVKLLVVIYVLRLQTPLRTCSGGQFLQDHMNGDSSSSDEIKTADLPTFLKYTFCLKTKIIQNFYSFSLADFFSPNGSERKKHPSEKNHLLSFFAVTFAAGRGCG